MLGVPSVVVLVHAPPHVTLALANDFGYMRLEIQQPASARQLRALIARCASRRFLLDVRALSGGPVPAQKQTGTSTRTWLAELLGEFEREVRCAAGGVYNGARGLQRGAASAGCIRLRSLCGTQVAAIEFVAVVADCAAAQGAHPRTSERTKGAVRCNAMHQPAAVIA